MSNNGLDHNTESIQACITNKHTEWQNNFRTEMAVFWVVAPCSLVEVYQRFRGPCCLHHQGELVSSINNNKKNTKDDKNNNNNNNQGL
jgi:hypothetical protein